MITDYITTIAELFFNFCRAFRERSFICLDKSLVVGISFETVLYDRIGANISRTGFIRSGKIRGKHIFFEMVRESQGKLGKVREFNKKVRENLEKVREIFLESSYLL